MACKVRAAWVSHFEVALDVDGGDGQKVGAVAEQILRLAERILARSGTSIRTSLSRHSRGSVAGHEPDRRSNADSDRVYDAFSRALNRDQRQRLMAVMARLVNEELLVMPLHLDFEVVGHVANLHAPHVAAPASTERGNVHEPERRMLR